MHHDLRARRPVRRAEPAFRRGHVLRVVPRAARLVTRARPRPPAPIQEAPAPAGFAPDPFVDYGRWLTAAGGILMAYKAVDDRLRHTLWRLFAWSIATAGDGWLLLHAAVGRSPWPFAVGLLIMAVINGLIVAKPVMRYRTIEIRPDGMILDGHDLFWLRHMADAWPAFQQAEGDTFRLCGVYGTRFVEFLTVERFDELDRTPEVFAAHLRDAMQQLWARLP